MTSRPGTFVFVRLPGATRPVVAARYEVERTPAGPLGRLVYGRSYLSRPDALALDPIHLPLSDEEFTTTLNAGMFGALRDTAPDAWGRLVLEHSQRDRAWTELD
ncbi:MAG: type II toxin-antitoxin system HipA family toxin, partial [Gemmatimonadetes bacterium]|nr:type II toxin-antitoxin system HipA family toxin [Gemmatimonadota bacterium]